MTFFGVLQAVMVAFFAFSPISENIQEYRYELSGGVYEIVLPQKYDKDTPVVLVLHGGGEALEVSRGESGYDEPVARGEVVAVYPQGHGKNPKYNFWNGGFCCWRAVEDGVDHVSFFR